MDVVDNTKIEMDKQSECQCNIYDTNEKRERVQSFIKRMPKLELHAHLNGCIRPSTLAELAHTDTVLPSTRTLSECFQLFEVIKTCVNSLDIVRRLTLEALEDFAKNEVAYVELRSTPKCFPITSSEMKTSKKQYIETIVNAMRDFEKKKQQEEELFDTETDKMLRSLPLIPRYIVSIDRSGTLQEAMEHVKLAIEYRKHNHYVVGVELGGNPTKNDFRDFEPAFQLARQSTLPISLHCGEIKCGQSEEEKDMELKRAFEETKSMISFSPDRLGHALYLPDSIWEILYKRKPEIPIECCPTSNVLTTEMGGSNANGVNFETRLRDSHPQLENWIRRGYPISINTDDPGIFATNSTNEYQIIARAFSMNETEISNLVLKSINHIFDKSSDFKEKLKRSIDKKLFHLKRINHL